MRNKKICAGVGWERAKQTPIFTAQFKANIFSLQLDFMREIGYDYIRNSQGGIPNKNK